MSILIQYLVKLTISLAIVWLFYQFVLRRLTFYNSNRWYLLAYTLLSFFIPFINISPFVENNTSTRGLIQIIPLVNQYTSVLEEASNCPAPIWSTNYDKWDFIAFGLMLVAAVLFIRFVMGYFSFIRIQRKAKLISADGVKIYQVDDNIIPFSFGNSIFINSTLHTETELEEIVRHEFVHVRQRHTIDIIWAEMLCIINWYNPFAWLLKRSIRQNLEFIADDKVIQNGINKKQYQYLLLKVIGNNQYSIATQFNFSSLKKRIAMMNKTKSAKRQLGRFLFLIPVFAVILLSFRQSFQESPSVKKPTSIVLADTIPDISIPNSKGYYIDIKDNKGNCTVVVKDKDKKEVKRLLLIDWNLKADYYENLYGEILSPKAEAAIESTEAIRKAIITKNPDITGFQVKGNVATITLKDGKTETYTLSIKEQKKAFEERCGVIQEVPLEAVVADEPTLAKPVQEAVTEVTEVSVASEKIADNFEINDSKAVMHFRNGKTEVYNLTNAKEKAAFEKKYGKIIKASATGETYSIATVGKSDPVTMTTIPVVPTEEVEAIDEDGALIATEAVPTKPVKAEILLTISKKTTQSELDAYKSQLKEKGIDLNYDEIKYEKGILVKISGTIRSKDNNASFFGVDFNKLVISVYKRGERSYFRIDQITKVVS